MKNENSSSEQRSDGLTRRHFVGSAAAAAGLLLVPRHVLGGPGYVAPSDKLNIAAVGIGGMGANNVDSCNSENIVALCDVDDAYAAKTFQKYPDAKRYRDYRRMLEQQKDIDAVIVATPDHSHAVIAMTAMQQGKHVYVQKPLTRTVGEARKLTETARQYKVKTQMGNQGHSGEGVRLVCEWIWDGAIGPVREVHCYTNRPVWRQPVFRPTNTMKAPQTMDWQLWLGPAPDRPYHPDYLPQIWRAWWDFGCGALGDMACHIMDAPFTALKLGYPTSVEAFATALLKTGKMFQWDENKESFPASSIVHFEFPARGDMAPVKLHWYDGGMRPPRLQDLEPGRKLELADGGGTIFVGDQGVLVCGTYSDSPRLIPETRMQAYQRPAKNLPRVEGSHEMNWVQACKDGPDATSNFDYAGPFTEAVVMGNLALRFPGEKLEWDGVNMRFTNNEAANSMVLPAYRKGWSL